jgi:hypothetical protein
MSTQLRIAWSLPWPDGGCAFDIIPQKRQWFWHRITPKDVTPQLTSVMTFPIVMTLAPGKMCPLDFSPAKLPHFLS